MTERDIFLAVLDLDDPTARAAYLDKSCGSDRALRARVEALLSSHESAGSFLGVPAVAAVDEANSRTHILDDNSTPSDSTVTRTEQHKGTEDDELSLSFLEPPTRPDSLGRIGHYEVLEVLGKGGFGIVFRAFDDVLQRVVAVKVMAPQLAATSPARKRFLREARSSAQVRHENVVQVYEIGEQPLPYLAMEFIPGETLQQRLDRTGPLDVMEVVRIGRQIAEGLAAAHATDLIHRDIKPSNILIEGGQQKVKLTDFGLARAADDASISQSGIIAGTPMYMAPEQSLGHKLDQRADLFSLGTVLYQMASGRPPFRANGTVAVLKRVAEDTPRDIREIIPETPQWLCNIIAKLHEKKPEDRFQSAREIADVLADCEQQLKAHGTLKDYSRIPGGAPRKRSWRPNRKLATAAGILVLLASLVYGVMYVNKAWYAHVSLRNEGTGLGYEAEVLSADGTRVCGRVGKDTASSGLGFRPGTYTLAVYKVHDNSRTRVYTERLELGAGEYRVIEFPMLGYLEIDCEEPAAVLIYGGSEKQAVVSDRKGPDAPGRPPVVYEAPKGVYTVTAQKNGVEYFRTVVDVKVGTTTRIEIGAATPSDGANEAGWVQLFNGKDLTGWEATGDSSWTVENGVLHGQGPRPRYLSSSRYYADFHLRMKAKISDGGLCNVLIRQGSGNGTWGPYHPYAIPLNSTSIDSNKTGCLVDIVDKVTIKNGDLPKVPPDTWFDLDVIAQGPRITIMVNGKTTAQHVGKENSYRGRIILDLREQDAEVHFSKIEIKELPPEEPGWVQLFNGKDLTGWKENPAGPTRWKVEGNILKAAPGQTLLPSVLSTERTDFLDFHLRMELRTNSSTRASIDMRSDGLVQTIGYGVWLMDVEGKAPIFSLTKGSTAQKAKPTNVKPEEWYQLEIIARGNEFQVKVDNQVVAQFTDENPLRMAGPITFFQMIQSGMLEFRKIEIKELRPSPPEVPKTAADVLPYLVGKWKMERQTVDPKNRSDKGTFTYGFIAGGQFLRGHCSINEARPDGDTIEGLDFWSFEPGQNSLRRWVARSDGFTAFVSGQFHPVSRTLITTLRVGADDRVQQYEFVDTDTFNFQVFQKDASGKITGGFNHKCIRVKEPVAVPRLPLDPMRPEETKVLDRLVGEWRSEQTVTDVVAPAKPKHETEHVKTELVLGGRFVERMSSNETNNSNSYTLLWFDTGAKQFRRWYFSDAGFFKDLAGTWDDVAKTLTFDSTDNLVEARETFKSDELLEFQVRFKNLSGKTVSEVKGVSRRIASSTLAPTYKNTIGMEFVKVPKGKSWLGGGKDKLGDTEMEFKEDFYLGKYEVTQEEWDKVMGENASHFSRNGGGKDAVKDISDADLKRFPVENMSWDQCQVFLAKLNQRERGTGWVYRLPKAAEWEYACRGGPMADKADSAFDFYLAKPMNTLSPEQANMKETGLDRTCKVGSFPPNRLGLFDMHGNVSEYFENIWERPKGTHFMCRGGTWNDNSSDSRLSVFGTRRGTREGSSPNWGLRLARVPSGDPAPEAKNNGEFK